MNKLVAHTAFVAVVVAPGGDGRRQNNHSLSEKHGLRGMPLHRQGKPASRSRRCQGCGVLQGQDGNNHL